MLHLGCDKAPSFHVLHVHLCSTTLAAAHHPIPAKRLITFVDLRSAQAIVLTILHHFGEWDAQQQRPTQP
jgi:hypothetical protein